MGRGPDSFYNDTRADRPDQKHVSVLNKYNTFPSFLETPSPDESDEI